jgi:hypothetical protein
MALLIGRTIFGHIFDQHLAIHNNAVLRFVYFRDNFVS